MDTLLPLLVLALWYQFDLQLVVFLEDFVSTIEKILQLCDIWAERIRRVLSGEELGDTERDAEAQAHHFSGSMIRA